MLTIEDFPSKNQQNLILPELKKHIKNAERKRWKPPFIAIFSFAF